MKLKYLIIAFASVLNSVSVDAQNNKQFEEADKNGLIANQGFQKCEKYMMAWLSKADPATGLIPRNLQKDVDIWNANDAAADNYPYMVMTAALLRPDLYKGVMREMLQKEAQLTSRIGHLPDTYSFSKQNFQTLEVDTSQVLFGSAEYMKDGLIPLLELLGKSPWSDRMVDILNDLDSIIKIPIHLEGDFYGNSADVEITGDLLQVLSRMYWMTGNPACLKRGIEIGDFYFNDQNLPTRSLDRLRLRDHGCEIIAGLSEIYATANFASPQKKMEWQPYMHEMLDNILAKGRNKHGLFYNEYNPQNGDTIDAYLADTWGYNMNAVYTVYLLDETKRYRKAVLKALKVLNKEYRSYAWEGKSSDGYADAIEGALNLYYHEPEASTKKWIDSQIPVMWNLQQPDGIIEGWHGDGNFARTTLMYGLWKTTGITVTDWNKELLYGSVIEKEKLYVSIKHPDNWTGKLLFKPQLHKKNLNLPMNYPRINQFQEWYPVDPEMTYEVINITDNVKQRVKGSELIEGFEVNVSNAKAVHLTVKPVKDIP